MAKRSTQKVSIPHRDFVSAIKSNDVEKVRELVTGPLKSCINHYMKVGTNDYRGVMSPLQFALMEGDLSDATIIKILLDNGASPRKRRDYRVLIILPILQEYQSPVFTAMRKQNLTIMNMLFDAGADVNETCPAITAREEEGGTMLYRDTLETCLHRSVSNMNPAVVQLLIERGANVNALNREDQSPLHCCGDRYHKDVFRLLLQANAMAENIDKERQSVLSYLLKPQLYDDGVEIWEEDELDERIESIHMLLSAGYNLYKDIHIRVVVMETLFDRTINGVCQNQAFMKFIRHRLRNPPSLDFIGCVAIRRHLGRRCTEEVVDKLPIPQKFKDYILLKSFWK